MHLPPGWKLSYAVVAVAVVLVSCQKSYHSADERYVFVCTNTSLPYWQEAKTGFMTAAHEMGVKAQFTGPSTYAPQEELTAFQNAVATHPSGILVSPAQAALFQDAINQAIQDGIPVICADSDSPNSRRILFIGTDNYRAGLTMGKLMAQLMQEHGRVVVITIPGQFNLDERMRGLEDALKPFPYMSFSQVANDRGVSQVADKEVSPLLQQKEDIGGIACLEASGGQGVAQAVDRYGDGGKLAIVAMDDNSETLDWISKGVINATVVQKSYTMAFYGLRFLDDLHHNSVHEFKSWQSAPASPLPAFVDTGTEIINAANVDSYRNALAAARSRAQ